MGIEIEKKGKITIITINNPVVKNAIDAQSALELVKAFREFEEDKYSRVAVLCGSEGNFCSGANLKAIENGTGNKLEREGDGPMGPTRMMLSKPVVAAISGYAVAGGLELALWCDLRIIEKNGIMGVFNRRWGIPLIDGGTIRLPRIIGLGRALDLILTGRPVTAEEALMMGLVTRVVDVGFAKAEAEKLAEQLADFPKTCLRHDRLSIYEQYNYSLTKALENEFTHGLESLQEMQEGIKRFTKGEGRHGEF